MQNEKHQCRKTNKIKFHLYTLEMNHRPFHWSSLPWWKDEEIVIPLELVIFQDFFSCKNSRGFLGAWPLKQAKQNAVPPLSTVDVSTGMVEVTSQSWEVEWEISKAKTMRTMAILEVLVSILKDAWDDGIFTYIWLILFTYIWAIYYTSLTWMLRPFWVGFPYWATFWGDLGGLVAINCLVSI